MTKTLEDCQTLCVRSASPRRLTILKTNGRRLRETADQREIDRLKLAADDEDLLTVVDESETLKFFFN